VLSSWAGAMLERWGVNQPCHGPRCTHGHQTREAVEVLVRGGILRYLPNSGRNVAAYTYGRTWKGVESAHSSVRVMQLV
jgi:hypothetical protein